ncbi:insulinase family protein [Candidatus Babeliales bacterium]|nr:insulinase family protein [Candidatus Babeliales bacterium]MCF7899561.1 insulinase family protein [Candidatus Babeliales bacterium]
MTINRKSIFFTFLLSFLFCTTTIVQIKALQNTPEQQVVQKVNINSNIEKLKNNIYKETLDNGLNILFYHKENTPEVMLKVMYDVGSKDEESSEYGFAHLVEHMIFKGTEKLCEQDIFEISRNFGTELNAQTSFDQTTYYFYTDNKNWKVFLNILADCMQNVRIADEHLASELKTVFDELKLRDCDSIDILTELLPSNHPYHHPIVGYKENLLNLNPEKVRAFYKKYYIPDRATIIVVGDLNKDEVINEIKKLFGPIKSKAKSIDTQKNTNFLYLQKDFFQKNIVIYKSEPYTSVICAWNTPGKQDIKNSLCSEIISEYLSQNLRKLLCDEKTLTLHAGANASSLLKAGVFNIGFMPQKQKGFFSSKNIEEVSQICKDIIIKEIEDIISKGIPQEEFNNIRKKEKIELLRSFDNCTSIADMLEWSYLINKNEYQIFDELTLLDSITNEDLKTFSYQYLRPSLMNLFTIKPLKDKEKDEWLNLQHIVDEYDNSLLALKEDRTSKLEKPITAYELPNPELLDVTFPKPDDEFTLSNGLHVVIKQKKDTPFIVAQLFVKNADKAYRYFSENKQGYILSLVQTLLLEGSQGYSKEDHRKFFDNLGASCFGQFISCLSSDFDAVAQRHAYILTKPTYPKKAINKCIKDLVEMNEKMLENENYVATDKLFKHLYQDDFLSKKTKQEEILELKKISRSDLIEFHKKYMSPQNLVLSVVGDFDPITIKQQLENTYGQLKGSTGACNVEKITANFPEIQNPQAKEIKTYLPKERIILKGGRITAKKYSKDFWKLALLGIYVNKILFELREQHGIFYDCSCNLTANATEKNAGYASIFTEVSLANKESVLNLIKSTLKNIAQTGVPEKDFEKFHSMIINTQGKAFQTNSAIANSLGSTKIDGHDWDHKEKRFKEVLSVTREEVNEVSEKYLNPDDWSFVIVGRVEETN